MAWRDWANAIASIESAGSGGYSAVGPATNGRRPYGRYQVMDYNIGPWTEKHLGRRMTPDEFLASPEAQDAVFRGEFGSYVEKYGNPRQAASMWFTGRPIDEGSNRSDILGTTGSEYVQKFSQALGGNEGQMAPRQSTMGLNMGTPVGGQPQQQPMQGNPLEQRDRGGFRDFMTRLGMAANAMQHNYNPELQEQFQQRLDKREQKRTENRTIAWLKSPRVNRPDLAEALQTGAIDAKTAFASAMQQKKAPTPYTDAAKARADLNAGYITQDQYDSQMEALGADDDKMTESERRIYMFNNIQKQVGPAINKIEDQGFDPSNIKDKLADGVLGGNWIKSEEGRMYNAAAGSWAESALRLATGAAATPEEYQRIRNMYFAQVGDSPETIRFKRAMRESYQEVLGATLRGDTDAEMPNPLMFAIEQYYKKQDSDAGAGGAREVAPGVTIRKIED